MRSARLRLSTWAQGRAVLLASELPFRRVLGVELNAYLAGVARRNAAAWRRAGRAESAIRIACADAVDCALPPGPLLVFLFNPFGAAVMRRFLARLAEHARKAHATIDLIYVNDEQHDVLRRHPALQRLFRGKVARSRVDARADHAILTHQPDGEYASADYEDCSIWSFGGAAGRGQRVK